MAEDNNWSKNIFLLLLFLGAVAGVFVLKTLSSIFIPVAIAAILGFVFLPVIEYLKKRFNFPWAVSSVLVILITFLVIIFLSSLLISGLSSIISNYSKYEKRLESIFLFFDSVFDFGFDEGKSFFENIWGFQKIRDVIQKSAITVSSGIVNSSKSIFSVFLLLFFFLMEMELAKKKIFLAFSKKSKPVIIISAHIMKDITSFLSIKFFVSLATGVIVYAGTSLIRMDFPIVWGFLAFCMNFIPIFGSIISCITTILFAMIQFFPSYWQIILVAILMLSVNMIIGNIVEPKIEGEGLGISPFVILISLSLWGYIWGFLGMLLAVPMTVIIKLVCENIDYLKPVAAIIGNGKQKEKKKRNQAKSLLVAFSKRKRKSSS